MVIDTAPHPPLPPGTKCPRCNYEIGVPDAAACPECGLSTDATLRAEAFRAEFRTRAFWWYGVGFILPLLCGLILRSVFVAPSALLVSVLFALAQWMAMLSILTPLAFIGPRAERYAWMYTWIRELFAISIPLVSLPLMFAISQYDATYIIAAAVMLALLLGVANIAAWRTRRRLIHKCLLQSRLAATVTLVLHVVCAVLVGAALLGALLASRL